MHNLKINAISSQILTTQYIDEHEASKITGMSIAWFQRDRWQGGGIPYTKLGRAVRYKVSDLIDFMESRKRRSTSDQGLGA